MRKGWLLVAICALAAACAPRAVGQAPLALPDAVEQTTAVAQDSSSYSKQETAQAADQNASPVTVTGKGTCACGAHPPGPPKDRVVAPYAGEPADLSPYV